MYSDINANPDPIRLSDLILRSADAALDFQREDGSFPPGQNAHYGDPQTPVRTTAHWLLVMLESYEITGDETYCQAATDAIQYLLSDSVRPDNATFYCRKNPEKDRCNGVMGQAIPILALATAAQQLEMPNITEYVSEVIQLHPFDEKLGMWKRVEIDGTILSVDRTLNHQIAFAAAISSVSNEKFDDELRQFMDTLDTKMGLRKDGVIRHLVRTPLCPKTTSRDILTTSFLNRILFELYTYSGSTKQKEVGYHSVNLFWLSKLKRNTSGHHFWSSKTLQIATEVIREEHYRNKIQQNSMGYTNTPTGFQNALATIELGDCDKSEVLDWIEWQILKSYDFDSNLLGQNAADPTLMASTMCTAIDLPDMLLFDSPTTRPHIPHEDQNGL